MDMSVVYHEGCVLVVYSGCVGRGIPQVRRGVGIVQLGLSCKETIMQVLNALLPSDLSVSKFI